ncbi:MAG TPA: GNAT family protein [Thermoanaerobaculia bacterium]|jgi:RimJ/RimL family protein N-acetyltransferase|nr:GNAT family protein [Thermoanaerobaculia bacterium]
MKVEPVCLEGRIVRLEPLTLDHAPGLWPHAGPEVFRWLADLPRDGSYEAFRDWIGEILRKPASLTFAMVLAGTGEPGEPREPVGVSGYLDIRPDHRGLEIGRTWIGKANQGSRINPESKYLLFRHAFETLGAIRVQLKTDLLNLHSQRAIEKLGAVREGTLRRYQIRSNGVIRDTVMYSVLAEEWPEVRARLEARLAE